MIYKDKKGLPFELKRYSRRDLDQLRRMYLCFSPRGAFQGMPPCDDDACSLWLEELLGAGINILALREDEVIGHCVLLPDPVRQDAEYLIFVCRHERGRGIGSVITERALAEAREQEIAKLWLTVERYNFRALALYIKHGFEFSAPSDSEMEKLMTLKVI